jgi:putative endonuclease
MFRPFLLDQGRWKTKRDFSLRKPTAPQERGEKKKSACSVRNDGVYRSFVKWSFYRPLGPFGASRDRIRLMERTFHVYIMASKSGVLYVGVTGQLPSRVGWHKSKLIPGFTSKYNVTKLAWLEPHSSARAAIAREKEIKKWSRRKKIALIESMNPQWKDLSLGP